MPISSSRHEISPSILIYLALLFNMAVFLSPFLGMKYLVNVIAESSQGRLWFIVIGFAAVVSVVAAVLNISECLRWLIVVKKEGSVVKRWCASIEDPADVNAIQRANELSLSSESGQLEAELDEVRNLFRQGIPVDWGVYESQRSNSADLSFRTGRTFATALLILAVMATFAGFLEVSGSMGKDVTPISVLSDLRPAFIANFFLLGLSLVVALTSFFGTLATQSHVSHIKYYMDHWVYPLFELPRTDAESLQKASSSLYEAMTETRRAMDQRLSIDQNLENIAQSLSAAQGRLDQLLVQNRESVDGLKSAIESDFSNPLAEVTKTHKKTVKILEAAIAALSMGNDKQEEHHKELMLSANTWKDIPPTLTRLSSSVEKGLEGVERQGDSWNRYIEKKDEQATREQSAMGVAIQSLSDRTDTMTVELQKAGSSIEASMKHTSEFLEQERTSADRIQKSIESVGVHIFGAIEELLYEHKYKQRKRFWRRLWLKLRREENKPKRVKYTGITSKGSSDDKKTVEKTS